MLSSAACLWVLTSVPLLASLVIGQPLTPSHAFKNATLHPPGDVTIEYDWEGEYVRLETSYALIAVAKGYARRRSPGQSLSTVVAPGQAVIPLVRLEGFQFESFMEQRGFPRDITWSDITVVLNQLQRVFDLSGREESIESDGYIRGRPFVHFNILPEDYVLSTAK